MTIRVHARRVLRWIAAWDPHTITVVGWIVFVLGCYPGYMDDDAARQLYTVRSGGYTGYSPVMTALWSALEYVIAGPFAMLGLQSGLFLVGTTAILRNVVTPRVAAVTAIGVLLFPPVFAVMAVIWPEALMAGALLAAFGAALKPCVPWRIIGAVLAVIAIACRPEAALAVIPLSVAVTSGSRWRRIALMLGVTLCVAAGAGISNRLLSRDDARPSPQSSVTALATAAAEDPASYVRQRWQLARAQMMGRNAVYDDFGDGERIRLLHHRATVSVWQRDMQDLVRCVAATPLFAPALYLVLAIAILVIAWPYALIRALALSGIAYALGAAAAAPSSDYRYAHWLVTATCVAAGALVVSRKRKWQRASSYC